MLARALLRPSFVAAAVFIVTLVFTLYGWPGLYLPSSLPLRVPSSALASQQTSKGEPKHIGHPHAGYTEGAHHEIFSVSTSDRKYFKIDFSPRRGVNPNAIPHPTLKDHWVLVGQLDDHPLEDSVWFGELVCTATFKGGVLSCVDSPLVLSIGKTPVRAYLHHRDSEARLTVHEGQRQLHW
jgi:hypothetical protein